MPSRASAGPPGPLSCPHGPHAPPPPIRSRTTPGRGCIMALRACRALSRTPTAFVRPLHADSTLGHPHTPLCRCLVRATASRSPIALACRCRPCWPLAPSHRRHTRPRRRHAPSRRPHARPRAAATLPGPPSHPLRDAVMRRRAPPSRPTVAPPSHPVVPLSCQVVPPSPPAHAPPAHIVPPWHLRAPLCGLHAASHRLEPSHSHRALIVPRASLGRLAPHLAISRPTPYILARGPPLVLPAPSRPSRGPARPSRAFALPPCPPTAPFRPTAPPLPPAPSPRTPCRRHTPHWRHLAPPSHLHAPPRASTRLFRAITRPSGTVAPQRLLCTPSRALALLPGGLTHCCLLHRLALASLSLVVPSHAV
ncbi:hypothetical protein DENSPDRAFT_886994, partial [Dentipellis sp. KUC8613]